METVNTASNAYMLDTYLGYQNRYAEEPAERDKAMLRLLDDAVAKLPQGKPCSLLDIGCSSGNLLRFLKARYPSFALHGGEVFPDVIERVRRDPSLSGITFELMDVRNLGIEARFDIVVANAVLFRFDDRIYANSCQSIAQALRPGGVFLALDFHHNYEQHLTIVERTGPHPEGLTLHFRPMSQTRQILEQSGFGDVTFHPFELPIDLPYSDVDGGIRTHTRRTVEGDRLQFRGAIFQSWCHVVARKA